MIKEHLEKPITLSEIDNLISPSEVLPDNLPKDILKKYYQSGRYHNEIKSVANHAIDYAQNALHQNHFKVGKAAAIFDIDETMLSNLDILSEFNFKNTHEVWQALNSQHTLPTLEPVKDLYNLLLSHNVKIFIITARDEPLRERTVKNLHHRGYNVYEELFLLPSRDQKDYANYKAKIREKITKQGHDIMLNIGDQLSDFEGGYFAKGFYLPNCFY